MNITLVEIWYKGDEIAQATIECAAGLGLQVPMSGFFLYTDLNEVSHMISADSVLYIKHTPTEKP